MFTDELRCAWGYCPDSENVTHLYLTWAEVRPFCKKHAVWAVELAARREDYSCVPIPKI